MIRFLGRTTLDFLAYLGEISSLVRSVADSLAYGKIRCRLVLEQIAETGFRSQPVVIVTGAFTGAVLAAQALFQFKPLGMETGGGALVSVAMTCVSVNFDVRMEPPDWETMPERST